MRLEGETVWLTQQHMAELFQVGVPTINYHLKEIFDSGELQPEATIRKFRIVRREGSRDVARTLDLYNLDAIISVGYRVKSAVATRFRIWATRQFREFIVKGFVLDDERLKNPDQPFDYFFYVAEGQADKYAAEEVPFLRSQNITPFRLDHGSMARALYRKWVRPLPLPRFRQTPFSPWEKGRG